MNLGTWQIDDLLTFVVNTHTPSTGAAVDADAAPTYRVYEDETGTAILTGSTALLDDANTVGQYSEQITLSAANGLEVGKCYTIRVSATVGGVSGARIFSFQVEAAPALASGVTVTSMAAGVITAASIATDAIDADALADGAITEAVFANNAITDAKVAADVTIASVTGSVGSIATGGIAAASFAAGAIDAAAIAANAIGASEIADGAIDTATFASGATIPRVTLADTLTTYTGNTPQTGDAFAYLGTNVGSLGANLTAADDAVLTAISALNNLSQANIRTAVGLASANLDAQLDALPTAAELTTALGTADDATLAAIATLQALVDDLEGRLTAARAGYLDNLSAGAVALQASVDSLEAGVNVTQINSSANAAARLALSAANMIPGTVDNTAFSPTTTIFDADDIVEATGDHYNGRLVLWTSGALVGQVTDVTDYALTSGRGRFTVTAMTEAPANNDTFLLV